MHLLAPSIFHTSLLLAVIEDDLPLLLRCIIVNMHWMDHWTRRHLPSRFWQRVAHVQRNLDGSVQVRGASSAASGYDGLSYAFLAPSFERESCQERLRPCAIDVSIILVLRRFDAFSRSHQCFVVLCIAQFLGARVEYHASDHKRYFH